MNSAAAASDNSKTRDYGRPPNRLLYSFARFLIKAFVKPYFHFEWSMDPRIANITGPAIVLGNHPSYLDPFLLGCAIYPIKVNFLASSIFFRNKYFEPLLYRAGVIPKTQFRADPGAVKAMLKVVKRGGILGIYPEGARSIDGTGLPIEDSISKFIKKVGGDVISGISRGSYLTWPRWSESGFRRGRIHIDIGILFTKEEVAGLSLQELHTRILAAFEIDENEWQKTAMVPFKSKAPAKGLHNVLHQCPRCMECWATDTDDDKLFCKKCGNTAAMDKYGFLHPQDTSMVAFETIHEWNSWQIDNVSKEIATGNYLLSDEADLLISFKDEPYSPSGSGIISLDKEGFLFKGLFNDEPVEKAFPLAGVLGIISDYGLNIALVSDQYTYLFILKNGQKAISYNHAQDILRKRAGNGI